MSPPWPWCFLKQIVQNFRREFPRNKNSPKQTISRQIKKRTNPTGDEELGLDRETLASDRDGSVRWRSSERARGGRRGRTVYIHGHGGEPEKPKEKFEMGGGSWMTAEGADVDAASGPRFADVDVASRGSRSFAPSCAATKPLHHSLVVVSAAHASPVMVGNAY